MKARRYAGLRVLALAAWIAGLAGCITAPVMPRAESASATHRGRFAVTYEVQGTPQREQGGFEWRSAGEGNEAAMQLLLTSALGTTVAALQLDPAARAEQRASLQTPQGTRYAASLPELMQLTLGWELPLPLLLPWLGTQAAPTQSVQDWDIAAVSRHENGTPKVLTARSERKRLTLRLVFDAPEP